MPEKVADQTLLKSLKFGVTENTFLAHVLKWFKGLDSAVLQPCLNEPMQSTATPPWTCPSRLSEPMHPVFSLPPSLPSCLHSLLLSLCCPFPLSFPSQWLLFFSLYFSDFLCRKKASYLGNRRHMARMSKDLTCFSPQCYRLRSFALVSHQRWSVLPTFWIKMVFKARSLIYWFPLFQKIIFFHMCGGMRGVCMLNI